MAIYGYIWLYMAIYSLKCVFWMSGLAFWVSGLVFGCLDLYFRCLDLYLGVWTCIWVSGLVLGCLCTCRMWQWCARFLINKKPLVVPLEDMSSFWTGRHVFLWNKKTCLLAQQEDMSSCSTRRHVLQVHRHPKTSPDGQIQVRTPKIQVQTSKYKSRHPKY